jgi:hypothetical protein
LNAELWISPFWLKKIFSWIYLLPIRLFLSLKAF